MQQHSLLPVVESSSQYTCQISSRSRYIITSLRAHCVERPTTFARCGCGICCRYDFEAYTETSEKMYRVFLRYAPVVMAVSCDEAFLEMAEGTDPMEAATRVRWTATSLLVA